MAPKVTVVRHTPSDETVQQWEAAYRQLRPTHEDFTQKLRFLMAEILRARGLEPSQIEFRTKSVQSFVEKARREGKHYRDPVKDMTDLVGLRIIAYDRDDVERVGKLIEEEFHVDLSRSQDKAEDLGLDRFGYLSVHYVVSLNPTRKALTEWAPFAELKAEVQVRTVLQHAWAAIDHKLRYKRTTEIPTHLRRKLFRLSALLELADDEFSGLKRMQEQALRDYSQQVAQGQLDIEVNLTSLDAFFRSTKEHQRFAAVSREAGFREWAPSPDIEKDVVDLTRRRLLQILRGLGVTTIREVADALKSVDAEAREVMQKVVKAAQERGISPVAIPYVVVGVLVIYARRAGLTKPGLRKMIHRSPLLKPLEDVVFAK